MDFIFNLGYVGHFPVWGLIWFFAFLLVAGVALYLTYSRRRKAREREEAQAIAYDTVDTGGEDYGYGDDGEGDE